MELETELYNKQLNCLPKTGEHIIGQCKDKHIVVYQAFNPKIANYAVTNQRFGGSAYNFERMSWIKPNFLWMMYRAGWAMKEHQQNILAIWFPLEKFAEIYHSAVHSSFKSEIYETEQNWRKKLQSSEVRLQWDPDHDPFGNKIERRAVQLGLRGKTLQKFATEWILQIVDITDFVKTEYQKVVANKLDELIVPKEEAVIL
ncbi:MAG: DUF4291 domain-containing protein [Pyrinomonadaceae bacterium]|jgi:hypothetical protein|nr:DUF4291 domain-containing protein [Pyrinomonadaceae bacterium]